jgi:hypothetical protein
MSEGIASTTIFEVIKQFIILQVLRLFFSTHVKKIFGMLAVQVESSTVSALIEKVLYLSPKERRSLP